MKTKFFRFSSLILWFLISYANVICQSDNSDISYKESLSKAIRWTNRQIIDYNFQESYELGKDIYYWGYPLSNSLALQSFQLPVNHPAYRYMTKFGRASVYDNALGVIALVMIGDYRRASGILNTLWFLMNEDGSIGFSFNTKDDNFYNRTYLRAGTIAWVGEAVVYYQKMTGDSNFQKMAKNIAE